MYTPIEKIVLSEVIDGLRFGFGASSAARTNERVVSHKMYTPIEKIVLSEVIEGLRFGVGASSAARTNERMVGHKCMQR